MSLEKMPNQPGSERKAEWETCPRCGGSGKSGSDPCGRCKGAGKLRVRAKQRYNYACCAHALQCRSAQGSNLLAFARPSRPVIISMQFEIATHDRAGRGSAVRRNRRPSASPMTTWTSSGSWRGIASCARPISRRWSAVRSIAPTIASNRLFHAGYIDRPRAQLDYYPTAGSAPIAYALADRGARLLIERDGIAFANVEWSRKNREAGRPFIEHQLEIMDFYVALQLAARSAADVRLIHPEEIIAAFPDQTLAERNPFALPVKLSHQGAVHEIGLVPDLVFGLQFADGSRRCFMVEIDRGTMPIIRTDFLQTSFERKMRVYLAAYAAKQHERHFGWKTFRVLTVTTDEHRMQSMMDALRNCELPHSPGDACSSLPPAGAFRAPIRSRTIGATAAAATFV